MRAEGMRRGAGAVLLACCTLGPALAGSNRPAASGGASRPMRARDGPGPSASLLGRRPEAPLAPGGPAPATPLEEGVREAAPDDAPSPALGETRAVSFLDVTPGETTTAELLDRLGEPSERILRRDETAWVYHKPPLDRVEFAVARRRVVSIVVFFDKMLSPEDLARQLELDRLTPTPVADQFGQPLGQAYPERGVVFSFAPSVAPPQVAQILLEPIRAELFVQRARENRSERPRQSLADLRAALRLDPNDAEAAWLKAEILADVGRSTDALAAARDAVRLAPDAARYRLTLAHLLKENGQREPAAKETQRVLEMENTPPELRARALCLAGDLLAAGPDARPREAIRRHQEAIDAATGVAADAPPAARREAAETRIDAYLGAARDIARGDWRRKRETALKWLEQADSLTDDAIGKGRIEPIAALRLRRKTLAIYAELDHNLAPSPVAARAIEEAERLTAGAADPLYRERIARELGRALLHAASLEKSRGEPDAALDWIQTAMRLLNQAPEASPEGEVLKGRLCFLAGSVCAVGKKDYGEATVWYEKAIPFLAAPDPGAARLDDGLRGQWLVSMGVSYWRAGRKERALRLTQQGADLTRLAVLHGEVPEEALAIPYGNLAWMHQQLGHEKEARFMASLARQAEASSSPAQRR